MATKFTKPELAVGDKLPDGFTSLRGAAYLTYGNPCLIYRRHFWYVLENDIVKHVCTSYNDGREKWNALDEERENQTSGADAVAERVMSAPTPKRQHEDW